MQTIPDPVPTAQPGLPETPGVRVLDLEAEDLVYDAFRNRIYASVPNREGALGDTVSVIDPETLAVAPVVSSGPNPRKLALSHNRQYLYVTMGNVSNSYIYTGEKVRRVDLSGGTIGPEFGELNNPSGISSIWDIITLPDAPQSVAIVHNQWGSGNRARLRQRGAAADVDRSAVFLYFDSTRWMA